MSRHWSNRLEEQQVPVSMAADQTACECAIVFERVRFSYDGSPVLIDVNLAVPRGEFAYVIGPNGGGKTTLLKLIAGLVRPQSGTVRVFGQVPEKARGRIGYVAQLARHDPGFPVTVMDVVLMGRLSSNRVGRYSEGDREAVERILKRLSIEKMAGRSFADLSGGQKQRALIARALVSEPDLVLLDEPTANIDVAAREDIMDLLEGLRSEITIVMVSHDVGFVPHSVNKVVCVNRTVVVHPTSEITAESVDQLYGRQMRLVRHDQLFDEAVSEDV